nr:MAG TPA: hypothetical protein [Caudoviricetes sp.]
MERLCSIPHLRLSIFDFCGLAIKLSQNFLNFFYVFSWT